MDFTKYKNDREAILKKYHEGNLTPDELNAEMAALDKSFEDAGAAANSQATGQAEAEPELTPEQQEYISGLHAYGERNRRLLKKYLVKNKIIKKDDELGDALWKSNEEAGKIWDAISTAGGKGDMALVSENSDEFERLITDLHTEIKGDAPAEEPKATAEHREEPDRPDDASLDQLADKEADVEGKHASGDQRWDKGVAAIEAAGKGRVIKREDFNKAVEVMGNEDQVDITLFHNDPQDSYYRTTALSKAMALD